MMLWEAKKTLLDGPFFRGKLLAVKLRGCKIVDMNFARPYLTWQPDWSSDSWKLLTFKSVEVFSGEFVFLKQLFHMNWKLIQLGFSGPFGGSLVTRFSGLENPPKGSQGWQLAVSHFEGFPGGSPSRNGLKNPPKIWQIGTWKNW